MNEPKGHRGPICRLDGKSRRLWIVAVALLSLCGVGCRSQHFGTFPDGLSDFPERPISADAAVEAAQPHLDKTFALCREARGRDWPDTEPQIRVKLEGDYYYVLKDNYPSMNADYGFSHAVKVNAKSGELTPPK